MIDVHFGIPTGALLIATGGEVVQSGAAGSTLATDRNLSDWHSILSGEIGSILSNIAGLNKPMVVRQLSVCGPRYVHSGSILRSQVGLASQQCVERRVFPSTTTVNAGQITWKIILCHVEGRYEKTCQAYL